MFFMILAIIGRILLTILKILLFLFLFVIFIVGLVLFVPIRYRFNGRYYENDKMAEVKISWLFHFVSFRFKYDHKVSDMSYVLKISGVKILPRKEEKVKKRTVKKAGNKNFKSGLAGKAGTKDKADLKIMHDKSRTAEENKIQATKESSLGLKTLSLEDKESTAGSADVKKAENIKKDKKRQSLLKKILIKIRNIPESILKIFNKIKEGIKKAADAVRKMYAATISGKEKAVLVKNFIFGYESRNMICFVRDNMLHLWKHIKPRYFDTEFTVGFDDPALTGQVLGAVAVFCGALGTMPCITPDFERQIFEGRTEVKGRIMIVVLIRLLIKIYISEETREFKKSYESIREVL